jgi:hypothetical protein
MSLASYLCSIPRCVVRTGLEPAKCRFHLVNLCRKRYSGCPSAIPFRSPNYFLLSSLLPCGHTVKGCLSIYFYLRRLLDLYESGSHLQGSNLRPTDYKSVALPTELRGLLYYWPESNRHDRLGSLDFKSNASTYSATIAYDKYMNKSLHFQIKTKEKSLFEGLN